MGAGAPAYQVTKAALNALTRTLAGELRGSRILVTQRAQAGWLLIWAELALLVLFARGLRESYGRRPCPTTVRPVDSSATANR
jgi:NAD(P)-dependent dehydrogenase (short-subunit alcohol dehydrogenase family)